MPAATKKKAAAPAAQDGLNEDLAMLYAADLLHRGILEAGESVKASEAARLSGREDVELRLARVILSTNTGRFTAIDRKWTLWSRFADATRAFERNLAEILTSAGQPLTLTVIARELGAIYQRSPEQYERLLGRTLANQEIYFPAGDDAYGLNSWLLIADGGSEEDVLFDNYLKPFDIAPYEADAAKLKPSDVSSVTAFLDKAGDPVPNKVLQFLAWKADPEGFDAAHFFTSLWRDGQAKFLSNGAWMGPKAAASLAAHFPAIADREVDEYGDNVVVVEAQPLTISDEDREQLIQRVVTSDRPIRATSLLENIFEVTPRESTFAGDLETLMAALREDDRVLWVGADRFLPNGTVPEYVFTVPEILHIPVTHFTDPEGNELDILLEDDGLDGGLQREDSTALAQDVLDEEAAYTPEDQPPATSRVVLKFHHKEIGTLPLSQLPPGFFPVDAPILQVELTLPVGHKADLWVNNEIRLVFGLLDWYNTLPVDSGVVFYLERQSPDKYVLTYGEETEPAMFISRNRVNELLELGRRADAEELPTFEIVREIMEHYRKGIEHIMLLTEVNIARRSTRRLVASLLSAYHCYFQRGGAWVFDANKLSQGFDKSKRKYLQR